MKRIIKKIQRAFTALVFLLISKKIPAELANKELDNHFFKHANGAGIIHKVVNGFPLYYNDELKKWRVSSLAFIWGHKNIFINVVKISSDKVPEQVKIAEIDWSV